MKKILRVENDVLANSDSSVFACFNQINQKFL